MGNFTKRNTMADDVISHVLVEGMTRNEVIAKLGKPDEERPSIFVYHVGPERNWMCIDYEVLNVAFDSAGRVADFSLHVD